MTGFEPLIAGNCSSKLNHSQCPLIKNPEAGQSGNSTRSKKYLARRGRGIKFTHFDVDCVIRLLLCGID